jgi:hypothetical protein
VLVVALVVQPQIPTESLLLLILAVVAVVLVAVEQISAAPVVQVLSSSRPINNEDKWKLKSIGCMESTPQCTC